MDDQYKNLTMQEARLATVELARTQGLRAVVDMGRRLERDNALSMTVACAEYGLQALSDILDVTGA